MSINSSLLTITALRDNLIRFDWTGATSIFTYDKYTDSFTVNNTIYIKDRNYCYVHLWFLDIPRSRHITGKNLVTLLLILIWIEWFDFPPFFIFCLSLYLPLPSTIHKLLSCFFYFVVLSYCVCLTVSLSPSLYVS